MSEKVNFDAAREKHAAWKTRIRDFLDNKIQMEESSIVSHLHCDLGKWYYSEGKEKYGQIPAMAEMEFQHIKLHQIARDIYELKMANDDSLPEWLADELNVVSDKIVNLLTNAENEINQ